MKISGVRTATIAASGATCSARCNASGKRRSRFDQRKKPRESAVTAARPTMVSAPCAHAGRTHAADVMDGDFCDRIGGKAVGELAANFAVRAPLTPKTVPFFDEFKKRTNRSPVYTAFGANDAVYIYAEAVTRAKTTNPDAVIKELEKTSYVGIPGTIEFDENHDVKPGSATYKGPALLFAQWRDGCKREVVVPKSMTGAVIPVDGGHLVSTL